MTEPGAVDQPPMKVVPMFVDELEPVEEPPAPPEPRRWWRSATGIVALAFALATATLLVVAIVRATVADFGGATTLAWVAIGTSAVAVVVGVVAIAFRLGRGWGIAGVVVGILANPYLLLQALTLLATVTT